MSLKLHEKKQLLESLEYIDDAMLSDTLSRVRTDAAVAGRATLTKKRPIYWLKQTAALVACTLLLSAIIPILSYVLSGGGALNLKFPFASSGGDVTEPQTDNSVIEQTEPEETVPDTAEIVPDEHGSEGLLYMINEDGATASFIGWGECAGPTAYIASVYEGLPVTQIIFIEILEQKKRLEEMQLTNPDYYEQTILPDDFSYPEIKRIVIPDSIEYVQSSVLLQCTNLESLHIGARVNNIDGSIYYNGERGRNFSRITVSPENQYYTEKGNCLIRIKDKVLLCGFADSVIPDDGSVEIIGTVAFFNKPGLKSVVVPEGVVRIMNGAFLDNEELVSVSLPSTIKTLFGSFGSNPVLTEFKFAGTAQQWTNMSKDWYNWISETSLTKVTCSDGEVELKFDNIGRLVD